MHVQKFRCSKIDYVSPEGYIDDPLPPKDWTGTEAGCKDQQALVSLSAAIKDGIRRHACFYHIFPTHNAPQGTSLHSNRFSATNSVAAI